jgi:hypothetical protein
MGCRIGVLNFMLQTQRVLEENMNRDEQIVQSRLAPTDTVQSLDNYNGADKEAEHLALCRISRKGRKICRMKHNC